MKYKEIFWFIFATIVIGAVVGNCVFIPVLYFLGFEMVLSTSLWCAASASFLYILYGVAKFIKRNCI